MPRVGFDKRSVLIDGERHLLISGAVHYPRSTPALWPKILRESRNAGLNCIETYVFWGRHESQEGRYDFSDRLDLGRFLDLCKEEGLYAILRIGPYICAETNFGGLPWWLIEKPGMVTRTFNRPFMDAMERWVRVLAAEIGDRQYTKGGPVVLVQMENEYCNVAPRYGADGQKYLKWCAGLANDVGFEVPQIMCEGAPGDVIETLNGFSVWDRIAHLQQHRPKQPALWTENWPGWYDTWGEPHHLRKAEEIAYEVLRFFAAGGTGVNYYMWHGGTNFGRDAMFLQATSYGFDAPLDEYGLPTDKSKHLAALHGFLRQYAAFFLQGKTPKARALPDDESGGVVRYSFELAGKELAVIVNGGDWPKSVVVGGKTIEIPNKAGMALVETGKRSEIVYRTWTLPKSRVRRSMEPERIDLRWSMLEETVPAAGDLGDSLSPARLPHNMLLATRDETDWGWYRATITHRKAGPVVLGARVADFMSVWVNGRYAGSVPDVLQEDRPCPEDFEQSITVAFRKGENEVLILVAAIGMIKGDWMIGAPMSQEKKGLIGPVKLDGKSVSARWEFSPGLRGERTRVFDPDVSSLMPWRSPSEKGGPLRWYRSIADLPRTLLAKDQPWALDIGPSLMKGMLWVNGRALGRYWQVPAASAAEARYTCHPHLINTGHDQPVQRHYHIPPDWLRPGENVLVIFEERGAVPKRVRLVRRK